MNTPGIAREKVDVLIVEDDEDDFFIARNLLSKATSISCDVDWAQSYEAGLDAMSAKDYDVCLVDYRLGARNGLDLLREATEHGADTPMILLTGQGDLEVDINAMLAGASDYLVKGQIDASALERAIRYARERKRAEVRIREQAQLLDKARDAIKAYDMDQRVIYWNKSAERLTGWSAEEVMGQRTDHLMYAENYPEYAEAWKVVLRDGEWIGELHQKSRSGEEIIVESRWTLVRDMTGEPKSVLVINTDITERKKLEAQFLRTQRMDSIGRLVGGIAHDLGNLLVPILLGVKVLQQRFAGDEKAERTLGMIQKSAQRGSDMVKQVLAFARGVEGERIPLRINAVMHEVEKITGETFPPTIKLETHIPHEVWVVKGDATQLQQVVMNLCVNARDAMPEGGTLRINVDNIVLDEESTRDNLETRPGKFVRIRVEDTGTGIPEGVIDKIFEPFFTTKSIGKGTGLGLSTVYSIVKSHGGFITVDSSPGKGTRFSVFLPAPDELATFPIDDGTTDLCVGNGELILVVDDESFILEATQELLERMGFKVVTACDGQEGLEIYNEEKDAIELVITDLMMPNMDGIEMIRRLKAMKPDLPVIAASGLTGRRLSEAIEVGAHACLSKPFTTEKLCQTLNEVLGNHTAAQKQ